MKAKVLKSFYPPSNNTLGGVEIYSITGGQIFKGQIIEVDVPIGGTITEVSYKTKKLIVGTDVELILENTNTNNSDLKKMQNQQLGSYMFVGGILLLSYIAYKLIKEK